MKPKFKLEWFLCGSFILLSQVSRADCPSFDSSRSAYASQQTENALNTLECLRTQNSKDYDSRRFLSDIYWWEGHIDKSKSEAESILSEIRSDRSGRLNELEFHLKQRLNRFRLSGTLDFFNASSGTVSQKGTNWKGELTYRTNQASEVRAGFADLQRVFKDGTNISNEIFNIGKLTRFSKSFYLDTNITYSDNALFSPIWSAQVEPHWVILGGTDLSFSTSFNKFTGDLNVMEFRGGIIQSFSRLPLNVGARLSSLVVFSDEVLPAGNLFTEWLVSYRWSLRADLGGGRALESPGLKNEFLSVALSSKYWLNSHLGFRAGVSYYNALYRTEDRLTLGMDVAF